MYGELSNGENEKEGIKERREFLFLSNAWYEILPKDVSLLSRVY